MRNVKSWLMIFVLVGFLLPHNSSAVTQDCVAYSNVAKLILLDDRRLDVEKQRSTAFSNKQVLTGSLVSYWSNVARENNKGKLALEIKAWSFEIVCIGVLTFLAGKYLSRNP